MPKRAIQVGRLLKEKAAILAKSHVYSPYLHCLLVLSKVTGKPKEYLIAHPDLELSVEQVQAFSLCFERLLRGEPLAYVTGEKEFWNLKFFCSGAALIPRPETELVVEKALALTKNQRIRYLVDLGTGTGVIGITLASIWKDTRVILTDISLEALFLARQNCVRILGNRARVSLVCCNWLDGFQAGFKADVITVNPPYVSKGERHILQESVRRFEPERALFAKDESGLSEIKKVFCQAVRHLNKNGVILCEIGVGQVQDAMFFIRQLKVYKEIRVFKDLAGIDRVIAARL